MASVAAGLAEANAAYPGYAWASCGTGPVSLYAAVNGCGTPSYIMTLTGASCSTGDTLSADKLTCTAGGGGGSTVSNTSTSTGIAGWLAGWFNAFLSWLLGLVGTIFVGLWALLSDFLLFCFDQVLDLVSYVVSGMSWDFSGFTAATYWNQLPADLISTLNLIGVPAALALIGAALAIRFVLQIIPFVRWGS